MSSSPGGCFRLSGALSSKFLPIRLSSILEDMLERVLALSHLDNLYRQLPVSRNVDEFLHNALTILGIRYHCCPINITRTAAVLEVAR